MPEQLSTVQHQEGEDGELLQVIPAEGGFDWIEQILEKVVVGRM